MKLVISIALAVILKSGFSQSAPTSLYYLKNEMEIVIFDNDTLKVKSPSEKWPISKKLIFINSRPVDSIGFTISNIRLKDNGFLGQDRNDRRSLYWISKDFTKRDKISIRDGEWITSDLDQYYIQSDFKTFNPSFSENGKKQTIIDLFKLLCPSQACTEIDINEVINQSWQIARNLYLVETCVLSDFHPACDGKRYFLIDLAARRTTDITGNLAKYSPSECNEKFQIKILAKTMNALLINVLRLNDSCGDSVSRTIILDKNMTFIGNALLFGRIEGQTLTTPAIGGRRYEQSRILNYYYYGSLDDGTQVLIPFELTPGLEIAMFDAFNEKLLSAGQVKPLSKFNLKILENSIYAKHNAKFQDPFLEAYFNLYFFYNKTQRIVPRVSAQSVRFSKIDLANLELIRNLK